MAALTDLSLTLFPGPQWRAFYYQLGGAGSFRKRKSTLSLAPGPTAAYGIDTLLLTQFDLAASGTTTPDLTAYTDAAGQASQSMARVKAVFLWLHSTEDNSLVTANPSGLTLGGAATPATLMFGDAASDKIKVQAGSTFCWMDATANGIAVTGSLKLVLLTNLDATNRALGRLLIAGSLS
jgi:hypothetical protein